MKMGPNKQLFKEESVHRKIQAIMSELYMHYSSFCMYLKKSVLFISVSKEPILFISLFFVFIIIFREQRREAWGWAIFLYNSRPKCFAEKHVFFTLKTAYFEWISPTSYNINLMWKDDGIIQYEWSIRLSFQIQRQFWFERLVFADDK